MEGNEPVGGISPSYQTFQPDPPHIIQMHHVTHRLRLAPLAELVGLDNGGPMASSDLGGPDTKSVETWGASSAVFTVVKFDPRVELLHVLQI